MSKEGPMIRVLQTPNLPHTHGSLHLPSFMLVLNRCHISQISAHQNTEKKASCWQKKNQGKNHRTFCSFTTLGPQLYNQFYRYCIQKDVVVTEFQCRPILYVLFNAQDLSLALTVGVNRICLSAYFMNHRIDF